MAKYLIKIRGQYDIPITGSVCEAAIIDPLYIAGPVTARRMPLTYFKETALVLYNKKDANKLLSEVKKVSKWNNFEIVTFDF